MFGNSATSAFSQNYTTINKVNQFAIHLKDTRKKIFCQEKDVRYPEHPIHFMRFGYEEYIR